jgi:hypothetical protein
VSVAGQGASNTVSAYGLEFVFLNKVSGPGVDVRLTLVAHATGQLYTFEIQNKSQSSRIDASQRNQILIAAASYCDRSRVTAVPVLMSRSSQVDAGDAPAGVPVYGVLDVRTLTAFAGGLYYLGIVQPRVNINDPTCTETLLKGLVYCEGKGNARVTASSLYFAKAIVHARAQGTLHSLDAVKFALRGKPLSAFGITGSDADKYLLVDGLFFDERIIYAWADDEPAAAACALAPTAATDSFAALPASTPPTAAVAPDGEPSLAAPTNTVAPFSADQGGPSSQ